MANIKDKIKGGMSDRSKKSSFNPKDVAAGQKVEMEHTDDPKVAREITRDHLKEDPDYYRKLDKMESGYYDKLEKKNIKKSEDLCVKCGACCHCSVLGKSSRFFVQDLKCKYLTKGVPGNRVCSVYKSRFTDAPWCLSLEKGINNGAFPNDCPYVREMPNYSGPIILPKDEYLKEASPIIKSVLSKGQPEWCSNEDWAKFLNQIENSELTKSVLGSEATDFISIFEEK